MVVLILEKKKVRKMENARLLELTALYVAGEISEEEKKELTILLENEENKEIFNSTVTKWNLAERDTEQFNADAAFLKFEKRLGEIPAEISYGNNNYRNRKSNLGSLLIKVAASIIIMLGLGTAVYLFNTELPENKGTELITKQTFAGQKSRILLSDGTSINLNSESTLRFPEKFIQNKREVYLDGEAYFEVKKNPDKPFIVHTGKISTIVLGTKFNVSAFPEDDIISVALVEGKVKVEKNISERKETLEKEKAVFLSPSEQLVYNKQNEESKIGGFEIRKTIGWKDNILVFDNEPLGYVFLKLSRTYGVKFIAEDAKQRNRKITTDFNDESVWAIIESIKFVTGMEYKTTSKNNELETIVFY